MTPRAVDAQAPTFAELGVRPETVEALASVGITRAFAIQEYALPIALRGVDVIGQAPTGTGKTLGFGIPILERTDAPGEGASGKPQALIVVPTRELNVQVARDLGNAGKLRGIRVLAVYGGVAYEPQVETLTKGVDIVVGTPGRLLDLAKQKKLDLSEVRTLVLDEADRMLDLGFLEDVIRILAMLPAQRQTMLFSATMPDPIVALSRRFLTNPVTIHAGHDSQDSAPNPLTKQFVYRTHPMNKAEVVSRILQAKDRGLTMIFCRTKRATQNLADDLDFRGFAAGSVHGDLGQAARERALRAFRTGKVDVLVATDVAARGIDVSGVTHVINYDCPEEQETYVHRIGRTGRAGATGVAVTFVDWEDMPRWGLIAKNLHLDKPNQIDPPETYHTSAHLFSDLEIPEGITGTLPSAQRTRAGLAAEEVEDIEGGKEKSRRPRRGAKDKPAAEVAADRPPRQRRRSRRVGDEDLSPVPAEQPAAGTTEPEVAPEPRKARTRTRTVKVSEAEAVIAEAEAVVAEAEAAVVAAEEVVTEPVARKPRTRTVKAPEAPATVDKPAPVVLAPAQPGTSGVSMPLFMAPVFQAPQFTSADTADEYYDDEPEPEAKPRRRK
nr:DEAD/DEAH box helicase [Longispora albida]